MTSGVGWPDECHPCHATICSAGGRSGINMNVWQHFERFVASDGILADDSEATKELAFVHYSPYLQDPRFVFDKLIKVLRSESADMERDRRADEARELRELKEKLEELTHVRDLLGHQVQLSRAKELTVSGSRACLGKVQHCTHTLSREVYLWHSSASARSCYDGQRARPGAWRVQAGGGDGNPWRAIRTSRVPASEAGGGECSPT